MKVINAVVKCPNLATLANSTAAQEIVHIFEGDDKYDTVAAQCEETFSDINEVVSSGFIGDYDVRMLMGGDLMWVETILGLAGCASGKPCHKCEISSADLCCTDHKKLSAVPRRTTERLKLQSHTLVGGTCPNCAKKLRKFQTLMISAKLS